MAVVSVTLNGTSAPITTAESQGVTLYHLDRLLTLCARADINITPFITSQNDLKLAWIEGEATHAIVQSVVTALQNAFGP